jgi:GNAT superfamily N-acetyltransferase
MELRPARAGDGALIHRLITALAVYEREPDAVRTTPQILDAQLSAERPPFECVIAEHDGDAAGFALYFHNYSTWRGQPGLYLEDLFVLPEARRRGVGRALLSELARRAVDRGCARMEWSVLNWNELAHGFYRELGARPMEGWTVWRLTDEPLRRLAGR